MDAEVFQNMLDGLKSGAGGKFQFLGEGKTRLRLVMPQGTTDPRDFYTETTRVYRGKERTRYLFLAQVVGATGKDVPEEIKNKVSPIVAPKTVLQGILALLAEGYDLLSPNGNGVTVIRSGKGLETSYNVIPSPKPIPLPDELEWPEESLVELGNEFYQDSLDRDANRGQKSSDDTFKEEIAKPEPEKTADAKKADEAEW